MQTDAMPGTSNVLRFPVERRARPTLDLLREIAPDVREVLATADDFRASRGNSRPVDCCPRHSAREILRAWGIFEAGLGHHRRPRGQLGQWRHKCAH